LDPERTARKGGGIAAVGTATSIAGAVALWYLITAVFQRGDQSVLAAIAALTAIIAAVVGWGAAVWGVALWGQASYWKAHPEAGIAGARRELTRRFCIAVAGWLLLGVIFLFVGRRAPAADPSELAALRFLQAVQARDESAALALATDRMRSVEHASGKPLLESPWAVVLIRSARPPVQVRCEFHQTSDHLWWAEQVFAVGESDGRRRMAVALRLDGKTWRVDDLRTVAE
jgi:hypothetical protein